MKKYRGPRVVASALTAIALGSFSIQAAAQQGNPAPGTANPASQSPTQSMPSPTPLPSLTPMPSPTMNNGTMAPKTFTDPRQNAPINTNDNANIRDSNAKHIDSEMTPPNGRLISPTKGPVGNVNQTSADRHARSEMRAFIKKDGALSANGQNIRVLSRSGKLTLNGRVRSAEEKARLEDRAYKLVGVGNVINNITVIGK